MRIIAFLIVTIILSCGLTYGSDSLSFEVKLTNIMSGASAKYKYSNGKVKVYKSRNDKSYRLIKIKQLKEDSRVLIDDASIQLLEEYDYKSGEFADYGVLDGYIWKLKILFKGQTLSYEVTNCNNKKLDELIKLLNNQLGKKKLIFETGLMNEDRPCY